MLYAVLYTTAPNIITVYNDVVIASPQIDMEIS